jgi:hypothetical protein
VHAGRRCSGQPWPVNWAILACSWWPRRGGARRRGPGGAACACVWRSVLVRRAARRCRHRLAHKRRVDVAAGSFPVLAPPLRRLQGVCVAERAPIRRVHSRSGRSRRPQADRWVRQSSAASLRALRHLRLADCSPRQRVSRVLLAAGPSMSGLCVLCVLCGSSLSQQQQPQQNNHRGHRRHRAEQTEGRQQGDRQPRCASGGVAFRSADS